MGSYRIYLTRAQGIYVRMYIIMGIEYLTRACIYLHTPMHVQMIWDGYGFGIGFDHKLGFIMLLW